MAISLKRYDRQVKVSAQTGTQSISGGLASSLIEDAGLTDKVAAQTFQMLGETGSKIYKDYQKRNDEAELARINKEFLIDSAAFESQLELLNDEEEIQDLANHFMISQQQKIDSFKLSPESKRQALISFENNLTKQGVMASTRILKVGLEKQDNTYLDIENDAINGVLREGFTSLESQYEYANKQRTEIGTKTYDSYLSDKRAFTQRRYFKEMSNLIKTNIDKFEKDYDASKLSQAQQEEIIRLRGQAQNKIDNDTFKLQTNTDRDLRNRKDAGLLTIPEIEKKRNETVTINGKEIKVITDEQANVLEALVAGRQTSEESGDLYSQITKDLDKLNKKEYFRMDLVDKILKKLYTVSPSGKINPVFSAPTTKRILEQIDQTIAGGSSLVLDKNGFLGGTSTLTPEEKEIFSQISSVFDDIISLGEKATAIGFGVQRMDALQDSFYNDVVINKTITANEWGEKNLPKVKKQIADIKARENMAPQLSLMQQDQLIEEAIYRDASGNRAKVVNGEFVEIK